MNYFLGDGNVQRGPYPREQLLAAGLRPDTLVWREGMPAWQPAHLLIELQPLLGQFAPPPATPLGYQVMLSAPYGYMAPIDISGTKTAAGICGILLGTFGVHKFVAGLHGGGVTMLVISLMSILAGFLTCGLTWFIPPIMHVIGIIEGIIYLTKSDAEFYQLYVVQKQQWF